MTTVYETNRWTTRVALLPKRPLVRRLEQEEDQPLTEQQHRVVTQLIIDRAFMPILRGEVSIRDSLTPAGGWARIDAAHPNIETFPVHIQLALVLMG